MTLDDHIEQLEALRDQIGHGNLEVMFQYQSSDYWRTEISQAIAQAEVGYVAPMAYHGAEKPVIVDEDEFFNKRQQQIEETGETPTLDEEGNTGVIQDGDKEIKQVVLLSAY